MGCFRSCAGCMVEQVREWHQGPCTTEQCHSVWRVLRVVCVWVWVCVSRVVCTGKDRVTVSCSASCT